MSQLHRFFSTFNKKIIVDLVPAPVWSGLNLYDISYSGAFDASHNLEYVFGTPIAYIEYVGEVSNFATLSDATSLNIYSPALYDVFTYPAIATNANFNAQGIRLVLNYSAESFPTPIIGGLGSACKFNSLKVGIHTTRTLREVSPGTYTFLSITSSVDYSVISSIEKISSLYSNPTTFNTEAGSYVAGAIFADQTLGLRGMLEHTGGTFLVPSFAGGPNLYSKYDETGVYLGEMVLYEDGLPAEVDMLGLDIAANGADDLFVSAYVKGVGTTIFRVVSGDCLWKLSPSSLGDTPSGRIAKQGSNLYVVSLGDVSGNVSLSKMTLSGTRVWYSSWSSTFYPVDHCVNSAGSVFVLLYQESYDSGAGIIPVYYLMKLNTSGELVWSRRIFSVGFVPTPQILATYNPRLGLSSNGLDIIVNLQLAIPDGSLPDPLDGTLPIPSHFLYKEDGSFTGSISSYFVGSCVIEDSTAAITVTATSNSDTLVTSLSNTTVEVGTLALSSASPTVLTFSGTATVGSYLFVDYTAA